MLKTIKHGEDYSGRGHREARIGGSRGTPSQTGHGEQPPEPRPAHLLLGCESYIMKNSGRKQKNRLLPAPMLLLQSVSIMLLKPGACLFIKSEKQNFFLAERTSLKATDPILSAFGVSTSGKHNVIGGAISPPASEQKRHRGHSISDCSYF